MKKPLIACTALALTLSPALIPAQAQSAACWGQATAVFAAMGMMGEHAKNQPNPRAGLRNLARELYRVGIIDDDSMAALGKFVAQELGLSIDACM
jgi:hypothetical protein